MPITVTRGELKDKVWTKKNSAFTFTSTVWDGNKQSMAYQNQTAVVQ